MTKLKALIGLMVLSGLCLCAFGASSASALTLEQCVEKAATTPTEYTNGTCETAGPGVWRRTPISRSPVIPTLTETTFATKTEGEKNGVHAVLHTVVAGISVQITCGKLSSPNSVAENVEGTEMGFKGTGKSVFSECKLTNPAACETSATLETKELSQSTSGMKVIFKPTVGSTFIEIPIGGTSCPTALKGTFPVTGSAVGLTEEGTAPTSISFNSESGNELKFGANAAQFTAKIHFSTENGAKLFVVTP